MIISNRTPGQFSSILDSGEQVLWIGRPVTFPFLSAGLLFLVFGLLWGVMDYSIISRFIAPGPAMPREALKFLVPFFLLHTAPTWLSILNIFRLVFVAGKTWYGFTDRRLLFKGGMWGGSMKVIGYGEIIGLEVTVNPIESMFGVGTIKIDTGRTRTNRYGRAYPVYDTFSAIPDPYGVYKQVTDVQTSARGPINPTLI